MNSQTYDIDLWNSLKSQYAASKMQELQSGRIVIDNRTMNFVYKTKGARPANGYTLIFGFHGGGGTSPQANNQQYNNHKNLYFNQLPDGCIWFTPRSCQDDWDMWFKDYLDDFILQVIRAFSLNGLIDLNKVFITGYSAGGDGVYQMAPRLADHLAGGAMMAGHPNGINEMNIRNIGFSIQVGQHDNSYNRKNEGIKYIRMLNQLGQNYGGFQQQSLIQPGKPHWMDLQDAKVLNWLLNFTRNPYPQIILFKAPPRRKKTTFYYLRLGAVNSGKEDEELMCFKQGNVFKIFSNRTITVLLNRKMVNPNSPVVIVHNGQVTAQRNMQFNGQVAQKTLLERLDPYYIFEDQIVSQPPSIIDIRAAMCKVFNISQAEKQAEYEKSLPVNSGQIPASWSRSLNPLVPRKNPLNLASSLSQIGGSIGNLGGQIGLNIGITQPNNNPQVETQPEWGWGGSSSQQNTQSNQGAWQNQGNQGAWGAWQNPNQNQNQSNWTNQQQQQQRQAQQEGPWSNQQGAWSNQQGGSQQTYWQNEQWSQSQQQRQRQHQQQYQNQQNQQQYQGNRPYWQGNPQQVNPQRQNQGECSIF